MSVLYMTASAIDEWVTCIEKSLKQVFRKEEPCNEEAAQERFVVVRDPMGLHPKPGLGQR
jgi:hypothetical protein